MTLRRVLVTRPQPGADRTAERLRALGFEPVVMPLTETVALPHVLPEVIPDLVLATSPQAFRHLASEIADLLSGIPLRVTGKATAASARQAGFLDVKETGGDVNRLMASLSSMIVPGLRILYLAGHVRRQELEHHLAARGANLTVVEVYDTLSVSYSTDKIRTLTTGASNNQLSIGLLYHRVRIFGVGTNVCGHFSRAFEGGIERAVRVVAR